MGMFFLHLRWLVSPLLGIFLVAGAATAAKYTDRHGNEGYDTAAECDAAVRAGTAKLYESFTSAPPLMRAGEVSVKAMPLSALKIPDAVVKGKAYGADNYALGACDMGAPHSRGRDGVSKPLQGKYVPFGPNMMVNVYFDKAGNPVRVMMRQCDNWFSYNFPRPLPVQPVAQSAPFQCPPDGGTANRPVVVPDAALPVAPPR